MRFTRQHPGLFFGWYICGACLFITLYTSGVIQFAFTAVFEPLAAEFNWSYTQISLAASIRGLEEGLLAPLMGLLVDVWGPRKLVFGGGILVGFGFLMLGRMSSLGMFYGAFALISVGMSACVGTVLITAVGNWFRRKAGIATGIVVSGYGLGGLLVPVVTVLIDSLGWRMAMFVIGLGTFVIVLPLSLLIRHKPEQYGCQPDGEPSVATRLSEPQIPTEEVEMSIPARKALRNRVFWLIALTSLCHVFVVSAVVTHLMPHLGNIGISRSASSLVALILPVTSIAGRLGAGWLQDRLDGKPMYAAGFSLMTVGLLLFGLATGQRLWLLAPFVSTFSLGWGINATLRMVLLRRYFGMSRFGTILGFTSAVMLIGQIAGPPVAGWVFDKWGSYQGVWLGLAVVAIAGLVLVLNMPASRNAIRPGGRR